MKKYFLVAALAAAPMLASTSAHAITVPEGSTLSITVTGQYATQSGDDITIGSALALSDILVSNINSDADVGLDGLTVSSNVTASGAFTLEDGANSGLAFSFATGDGASFTINQTTGSFASSIGPGFSGQSGLGVLVNGSTDAGSFSFATTSDAPTGSFLTTFNVPPEEGVEEEFSPIPLPAAAWMLLAGIGALWAFRRRTHA